MKIISGGQTGVDRGALDAAIELGVPHGGACPKGRLAEDGQIPPRYELRELSSKAYNVRTEQNVLDADATLILCHSTPTGGTELTVRLAQRHLRPCLIVDLDHPMRIDEVVAWLNEHNVETLNVAGSRESQRIGIREEATRFVRELLKSLD